MSRLDIHEVKLEIVRPGKPHNQLLSPLTPYMALCGEGSPITFNIDFEHHQLLMRLERLRYVTISGQKVSTIPERMREAEVGELGNDIARVFAKIETLSTEIARAQGVERTPGGGDSIVHLRLVVSGSELSLIPFEMAVAPIAYPGEGLEFCLQASLPVVVTREIRRSRPLPITWSRSSTTAPKVLVAYAEPEGMKVPAQAHIQAIRAALEPWIRHIPEKDRGDDPAVNEGKRLPLVKKRICVLPNASIDSIYNACAAERFTHVHILAHGDTFEYAGDTRFGVALCAKGSPQQKEVVSGKRLAKALQAEDAKGCGRSEPLVVTLATCDSGNQMTVLVPGGSIAHDLHVEGVPWVFASQFPLTVIGSVRMAENLYPRLFRGDDPRQVLFELRRQLYQGQKDHDWASIVAYAALPRDFTSQVAAFRSRQIKQAINVCLDRADAISESQNSNPAPQAVAENTAVPSDDEHKSVRERVEELIETVEMWLTTWAGGKPTGDSAEDHVIRAEIFGMHGSTYKRIALLLAKIADDEKKIADDKKVAADENKIAEDDKKVADYYRKSIQNYRLAMEDAAATGLKYYWSATQYLALQAVRKHEADVATFNLARALALNDTASNVSDDTRAWAYATLAELAVLETYHTEIAPERLSAAIESAEKEVENYCEQLKRLKGARSFHVGSTLRQLKRYERWKDDRWNAIVEKAIKTLNPSGLSYEYDYPDEG